MSPSGRTVVLVSYQLNQIRSLSHRRIRVDTGQIRMDGNTHEVVSAYESATARGDTNGHWQDRGLPTKARFLSWEIVEPGPEHPHTLATLGPIALKCGWTVDNVELQPGVRELRYSFPMLRVRPGRISWAVSLYEEGQLLYAWECLPVMIVATENLQHRYDH